MKYVVIKDLIERVTLKQFKAGDIYPCQDTARAQFLIDTGYIKAQEDEKPVADAEPKKPQKTTAKRSTKTKKA